MKLKLLNYDDFLLKVNEGLIRTVDIDHTKNMMFRYLSNGDLEFKINIDKSSIIISMLDSDKVKNESVVGLMNNMGWFPSYIMVHKNDNKGFKYSETHLNNSHIDITFESKFDEKVEDEYDKLYHVTTTNKVPKIIKRGLSPKSNHRLSYHPDRVYLTSKPNDILVSFLRLDKLYSKDMEYSILEIDNENLELYHDPNFDDGFYTYDNIHPDNIIVLD
jgi:hypothetical protein